jgi:hypothetical protein
MYDDLGNQNLIVVLFIYNTRNIQVKYCTILSITAAFLLLLKTALFGLLYHLRLLVECTLFCNLQNRARTHAVLVIGLYELLDPAT